VVSWGRLLNFISALLMIQTFWCPLPMPSTPSALLGLMLLTTFRVTKASPNSVLCCAMVRLAMASRKKEAPFLHHR
jgi:hypothetical protein